DDSARSPTADLAKADRRCTEARLPESGRDECIRIRPRHHRGPRGVQCEPVWFAHVGAGEYDHGRRARTRPGPNPGTRCELHGHEPAVRLHNRDRTGAPGKWTADRGDHDADERAGASGGGSGHAFLDDLVCRLLLAKKNTSYFNSLLV